MSRKTEIMTAACTLGCAVGIGFVMQNGEIAELRYGSGEITAMSTTPVVGKPAVPLRVTDLSIAPEEIEETLDAENITLTSAKIDILPEPVELRTGVIEVSAPASSIDDIDAGSHDIARAPDCELTARATPTAGAMVDVTLEAPCYSGERVAIRHEEMNFAQNLSATGNLKVTVPALVSDVSISFSFLNGEVITAFADVPSVPLYDRVVLQWQGNIGAQIHAREFGAEYGAEGHVWAGAPRDFTAVVAGAGGFLTSLGDPASPKPMLAEVYTFPSGLAKTEGGVALTVEAEVTDDNCGSELRARTFQYSGGKEISSQHMSLAVPNCSAVGNFLVLNNLLQDLTVARK